MFHEAANWDGASLGRGRDQLPELSERDDAWQQPWSLADCVALLQCHSGVDKHDELGSERHPGHWLDPW